MSLPLILLVVIADVHSYISEYTQLAMLLSALISFFAITTRSLQLVHQPSSSRKWSTAAYMAGWLDPGGELADRCDRPLAHYIFCRRGLKRLSGSEFRPQFQVGDPLECLHLTLNHLSDTSRYSSRRYH